MTEDAAKHALVSPVPTNKRFYDVVPPLTAFSVPKCLIKTNVCLCLLFFLLSQSIKKICLLFFLPNQSINQLKIQHVFTSENLPFQYTPKFAEVGVKMDYFDKSGIYENQISTGMAFKHARQRMYVLGVTLQKASVVDADQIRSV